MLEIGNKAQNFTLQDEEKQEFRLSDHKGKWVVLYFYPKDNTPGCTTEALEFTALGPEFEKLGAVIVGISPDSCESHQKFKVKLDLKVKLLADPERKVLETYGAWGKKKMYGKTFLGVNRSTVLINPEGKISYHWPKVKARGHAPQVKEKLIELQSK